MAPLESYAVTILEGVADGRLPSIFAQRVRHVTLKFEKVTFKIKTTRTGKETERTILKGVSSAVLLDEMRAMMVSPEGGKTTLLTVLGGRIYVGTRHQLTGSVMYNGSPATPLERLVILIPLLLEALVDSDRACKKALVVLDSLLGCEGRRRSHPDDVEADEEDVPGRHLWLLTIGQDERRK